MGTQALAFWKGPADPGVKRLHSTLLPNIHNKRKLKAVVSAWITFMVVFLYVHVFMRYMTFPYLNVCGSTCIWRWRLVIGIFLVIFQREELTLEFINLTKLTDQ